eukprot:TRINITY_DN2552_c1_g2_i1.p1 TRINITY_DN2552_c1_g2~~TRINITY_DN2552_c1_g2_i1.p1  ORF type:complete len:520 (-),score=190.83 TRINITY_DN2552_c1_g2_i1:141-1664(-)
MGKRKGGKGKGKGKASLVRRNLKGDVRRVQVNNLVFSFNHLSHLKRLLLDNKEFELEKFTNSHRRLRLKREELKEIIEEKETEGLDVTGEEAERFRNALSLTEEKIETAAQKIKILNLIGLPRLLQEVISQNFSDLVGDQEATENGGLEQVVGLWDDAEVTQGDAAEKTSEEAVEEPTEASTTATSNFLDEQLSVIKTITGTENISSYCRGIKGSVMTLEQYEQEQKKEEEAKLAAETPAPADGEEAVVEEQVDEGETKSMSEEEGQDEEKEVGDEEEEDLGYEEDTEDEGEGEEDEEEDENDLVDTGESMFLSSLNKASRKPRERSRSEDYGTYERSSGRGRGRGRGGRDNYRGDRGGWNDRGDRGSRGRNDRGWGQRDDGWGRGGRDNYRGDRGDRGDRNSWGRGGRGRNDRGDRNGRFGRDDRDDRGGGRSGRGGRGGREERRERPEGSFKRKMEGDGGENKRVKRDNDKANDGPKLHPSWEAKRKLATQALPSFAGKKVKFDD